MLDGFKLALFELTIMAGEKGLDLPPYKGSTLRGGFGTAFRKVTCVIRGQECKQCMLSSTCPYAYIFETSPPPGVQALSRLDDIPRPFVFEPPLERKVHYEPGEELKFNLVLIGNAINYLPYFLVSFQELGNIGIGKGRKSFSLKEVNNYNPIKETTQNIFAAKDNKVTHPQEIIKGEALPPIKTDFAQVLSINFETMTRLKHSGQFSENIEFHILIRNLLRRISSLFVFHHGIQWSVDFKDLIAQAEKVKQVGNYTRWEDWERYSNRQNARMNLGGIVGSINYKGDLAPFLPLLQLGELIHVGKACTFGMGKYLIKLEQE